MSKKSNTHVEPAKDVWWQIWIILSIAPTFFAVRQLRALGSKTSQVSKVEFPPLLKNWSVFCSSSKLCCWFTRFFVTSLAVIFPYTILSQHTSLAQNCQSLFFTKYIFTAILLAHWTSNVLHSTDERKILGMLVSVFPPAHSLSSMLSFFVHAEQKKSQLTLLNSTSIQQVHC